jgi:hypothetical protein
VVSRMQFSVVWWPYSSPGLFSTWSPSYFGREIVHKVSILQMLKSEQPPSLPSQLHYPIPSLAQPPSCSTNLPLPTQAGVLGVQLVHELQHAAGPHRPAVLGRGSHAG